MVILEAILAVCGILCIAASFLLTEDEQKTSEQAKQPEKTVLSDGQKEEIRRQVKNSMQLMNARKHLLIKFPIQKFWK